MKLGKSKIFTHMKTEQNVIIILKRRREEEKEQREKGTLKSDY